MTKGSRSSEFVGHVDKGFEVNIYPLDSILRVDNGKAVIESKRHNQRPFDTHTPIGPGSNSDLGPVWSREMNMDDFGQYNALLDRLAEPDVKSIKNT